MGAATNPARICPECGTRNSGLSLFCAECGASLTSAAPATDNDTQTTITFRPTTDSPESDPYSTQQFQPQSTFGNTATSTYSSASYDPDDSTSIGTASAYRPEPESRRGLVLGWIAAILILLVIAWLVWTSFLDPDTRDSITGLFT